MYTRRIVTSIAAVGAIALITSCGSAGGAAAPVSDSAKTSDIVEVTVAAMAISNTAPIHLGEQKGFFDEEGIDLTITEAQGGADIPGVVSGQFDFAFGNLMSVLVAKEKGLDLQFVANAVSATTEVEPDTGAVIVMPGSGIESAADLEGKTVSVNNLSNIGDTTIRMVVDSAGGDSSKIKFMEVDFPNAAQALELGQVDAAWVTEPFITIAQKGGAEVLFYNFKEAHPQLDVAGYFTSAEFIESHPAAVERFQSAMARSLEYAQEHPDEVKEIIPTYTEMDETLLQEIVLPDFRPGFDREAVTALTEAAVDHGTLQRAPDFDELLP